MQLALELETRNQQMAQLESLTPLESAVTKAMGSPESRANLSLAQAMIERSKIFRIKWSSRLMDRLRASDDWDQISELVRPFDPHPEEEATDQKE
jgi:hypothetical protein